MGLLVGCWPTLRKLQKTLESIIIVELYRPEGITLNNSDPNSKQFLIEYNDDTNELTAYWLQSL
jgi:hypothetical protein